MASRSRAGEGRILGTVEREVVKPVSIGTRMFLISFQR